MAERRRSAHVLATAIIAVLGVAIAVLVVQTTPEGRSQAAPPPAVPAAATPAAMAPPSPSAQPAANARQAPRVVTTGRPATRLSAAWGIDVSWPQCDPGALPDLAMGFVAVGVNDGRPFTDNPCLATQVAYAKAHSGYTAYLNIDAPRGVDPGAYGKRVAVDGLARASAAGLRTPVLWLDVEVANHWADPATNVAVIGAAVRALQAHHVMAGIYSSQPMWQQIADGVDPGTPVWLATSVTDYRTLGPWCASGLGGRPAVMAQYVGITGRQLIDVDVLCAKALPDSVRLLSAGRG
jgi:hypothetical protein